MNRVVNLAQEMIRFPSVSSQSNTDIADFVASELQRIGFECEVIDYLDSAGVVKRSLVACRMPSGHDQHSPVPHSDDANDSAHQRRGLAYFAHSDVVPAVDWAGPASGDAFDPVVDGNRLYGRGSCDMKGSLAAMLVAAEQIPAAEQSAPFWIVVTADEEIGFGGAKQVVAKSERYQTMVRQQPVAIIGEPTLMQVVHAHKGIRGFRVLSTGKAAHSSTRDGQSAALAMIPFLTELKSIHDRSESDRNWMDDRFDPPTLTMNIVIGGSDTAMNITQPQCRVDVSLRTMPSIDGDDLIAQVEDIARRMKLTIETMIGSDPVWVDPESDFVQAMVKLTQTEHACIVCYGTDGGVFTQLQQMVVCGPGDIAQAHTVDEWIDVNQLHEGVRVYQQAIRRWCCPPISY